MEPINLENLLEKYFDGQSSLSEEKLITDFFTSNNVPEHLLKYKPMFSFLEKEKKHEFKNEILLKNKNKTSNMLMVAFVTLLAGIGIYYIFQNQQAESYIKINANTTPEIALVETQKALQLLSTNVNIGINSVSYINEFHKTKNRIFREQ